MIQSIVNIFSNNPRRLFLIDGIGALVSAFFLGIVLVKLESIIGMPRDVLFYLAAAPCLFAVYSLSCYFVFPDSWRLYLWVIAIANVIYCIISLGIVFYLHEKIELLGYLYFAAEVIVVVSLAGIELQVSKATA